MTVAVEFERPNEDHANRSLLGVRPSICALPDVERNAVDVVIVTGIDSIFAGHMGRVIDLTATAFRARGFSRT